MLALYSPVTQVRPESERFLVTVGGSAPTALACRNLINAAGLGAPGLVQQVADFPRDKAPQLYLARGNYFALQGAQPFRHLVYPVPEPGGLGVHATLDMAGKVRFAAPMLSGLIVRIMLSIPRAPRIFMRPFAVIGQACPTPCTPIMPEFARKRLPKEGRRRILLCKGWKAMECRASSTYLESIRRA